eukprot:789418-Rhodomonas_salina.1
MEKGGGNRKPTERGRNSTSQIRETLGQHNTRLQKALSRSREIKPECDDPAATTEAMEALRDLIWYQHAQSQYQASHPTRTGTLPDAPSLPPTPTGLAVAQPMSAPDITWQRNSGGTLLTLVFKPSCPILLSFGARAFRLVEQVRFVASAVTGREGRVTERGRQGQSERASERETGRG